MDLGFFEGAGRVLSLGAGWRNRNPPPSRPGASIEGAPDHAFG
jgi:hypothetical protein